MGTHSEYGISMENILTTFRGRKYVYNKTEDRIFERLGPINYESELFDDKVPTLAVDLDGDKCNFTVLRADNTYEVLLLPQGFDYKKYALNR